MAYERGILEKSVFETPVAVVDLETTGLTAGRDRIVEISVVRVEPGQEPTFAMDTLVNPMRRVAATEIHGITDTDVANAPRFADVAGDFVAALSGCVVAAYNVYFDMRFITSELRDIGIQCQIPHFCLMYMRPMLGLGKRCRLAQVCEEHGVEYDESHVAAEDAMAAARLLTHYYSHIRNTGVSTFEELAELGTYKFVSSFRKAPLPAPCDLGLTCGCRLLSRSIESGTMPAPPPAMRREVNPLKAYWDALLVVLADLEIDEEEMGYIVEQRAKLKLQEEQVRALHARVFSSVIAQFVDDQWLDDKEAFKLRRLHRCLAQLGWAPGQ